MKKITLFISLLIAVISYGQNCPTSVASGSTVTIPHFKVSPGDCPAYIGIDVTIDGILCTFLSCSGSNLKYTATSPLPSADTFTVVYPTGSCMYVNGILETLSSPELSLQKSLSMFPNPVDSGQEIQIQFAKAIEGNLRVFNLNGQLISKHVITEQVMQLKTEALSAGVYILRITSEQDILTRKFIVK